VRDSLDVKRFMMLVIVALIPHLCFGIYNSGFQSRLASGLSTGLLPVIWSGIWLVLPMVIVTYVVGLPGKFFLPLCASTKSAKAFSCPACCSR
jgi:Na+-transporting NADH:ubiquinone oxidoreductase subunit B